MKAITIFGFNLITGIKFYAIRIYINYGTLCRISFIFCNFFKKLIPGMRYLVVYDTVQSVAHRLLPLGSGIIDTICTTPLPCSILNCYPLGVRVDLRKTCSNVSFAILACILYVAVLTTPIAITTPMSGSATMSSALLDFLKSANPFDSKFKEAASHDPAIPVIWLFMRRLNPMLTHLASISNDLYECDNQTCVRP